MLTTVLICAIFVPQFLSVVPKSEYYVVRSEAQCANYANTERGALAFNVTTYRMPIEEGSLQIKCGKDLRDCKDITGWNRK